MERPLFERNGTDAGSIELPAIFETPIRPDLIRRAFVASHANASQPDGADPFAGKRTSAESFGAGRGVAMVPRSNNRARRVPQATGGRRAHPPKAETDRSKDMNDQERRLAVRSALAATANTDTVRERGHRFDEDAAVPIVVEDDFESLEKTRDVVALFEEIGIADDVERADENRNRRAGRGKTRGRAKREPASVLVVTSSENGPSRAARNLPGVTVATGQTVNVADLAPGGHPGRLTVFTESALSEVAER